MTTSDFLTDPYSHISYPWEHDLIKNWILQYFHNLRYSPEFTKVIQERANDFEMIPVPKSLINIMRAQPQWKFEDMVFGVSQFLSSKTYMFPGDNHKSKIETMEKIKSYPILSNIMRLFVKALEEGNAEGIMKTISDDYIDELGRDKKSFKNAILGLIKLTSQRKIILAHASKFDYVDGMIVAKITGAWEAELANAKELMSDFFAIEAIFGREKNGEWMIRSMKHES